MKNNEHKKRFRMINSFVDLCLEQFHELYGKKPSEFMINRFDDEMRCITENHFESNFLSAYEQMNGQGYCSAAGASFIAYLLGITDIIPLPPHYHCISCHRVEYDSSDFYCGADKPRRICPRCGMDLSNDGFNIPYEAFFGLVPSGKMPDFSYSSLDRQRHERLHELEVKTGCTYVEIDLDNTAILASLGVCSFEELIKKHGVAEGKAKVGEPLPCKEDIFLDLCSLGMPREEAFRIMEITRKGFRNKEMIESKTQMLKQYGVSDDYIEALKNTVHLSSKADAVSSAMYEYRMRWYKVHFEKAQ